MEDVVLSFMPPSSTSVAQAEVHRVWAEAKSFAVAIKRDCPPGREQALALTKLEEAAMWATKALTRPNQETLL